MKVALAEDRRMQFRIGVNLGDVVEQDDGTIYGDGVNIAARLESLALAGGVTLSGQVRDFIEGKIDASIDFIGEHQVKKVVHPVQVYQIESSAAGGADSSIKHTTQCTESCLRDRRSRCCRSPI